MSGYANNDVLVTTDWVHQNLKTAGVRIVEVDVDPKLYAAGHVPGAVGWDWNKDLQDPVRRDIPSAAQVSGLLSRAGVRPTDTVVLYGDSSNWFAAYGFWVLKLYGHRDVRLMNGGRVKWLNESDKPMVTEVPRYEASAYTVSGIDQTHRALLTDVLAVATGRERATLVDVRSPDEFSGKVIAPPGMSETAQRGGHIPGALSVPWASAVNQDGTFKSAQELRALYLADKGVSADRPAIAYCRIGERSSHTWFVLKYLLGLEHVKNYDGSWTEYGSVIGVPIEK